jgi:hypothetical protein
LLKDAVLVVRSALRDAWGDLWTVLVCNLIWLFSVLLIIPGPPATVAMFYYTNRLAHGEVADLQEFWFGLRHFWGVSWRWGLANALMIVILVGDYILTGRLGSSGTIHFIQGFYLALLAVWIIWQLYTLPFLFEQKVPSVFQALRNGAVMLGKNVGFSVTLALLLMIVLGAGVLIFMLSFVFGGMILAAAGNYAVLNRLGKLNKPPKLV